MTQLARDHHHIFAFIEQMDCPRMAQPMGMDSFVYLGFRRQPLEQMPIIGCVDGVALKGAEERLRDFEAKFLALADPLPHHG